MGGAHFPGNNGAAEVDVACCDGEVDLRDVGKMEYGCEHYRRRCKIVARAASRCSPAATATTRPRPPRIRKAWVLAQIFLSAISIQMLMRSSFTTPSVHLE